MATWILAISDSRPRRDGDSQARTLAGVDLESSAKCLDSLAHAAKPVALALDGSTPIVVYRQMAPLAVRCQLQAAARGTGVPQDVGDRFAQHEREYRIMRGLEAKALRLAIERDACGMQGLAGACDLDGDPFSPVAANRFAHLAQRLARDLLHLADFPPGAL